MIEPCVVREVAICNLHMLEPAHAAAHLLNPHRRSLRYYESLQTTSDNARVVEECDKFLLAQTGGDPVSRLYRTVCDQMRHSHLRRGDQGDRQLSDAEVDDCRGDPETERCAAWWFAHGRHHPELRTVAIRVMHLWTSASPAERNWAQHERINTARRCKLGFAKLAQLVEIATNLKLAACAQEGGGYVLPWVLGTGREETAREEEDDEADVELEVWGARPAGSVHEQEIQQQVVAFHDSRPSRARAVQDMFGRRGTELRPWPEAVDDGPDGDADDDDPCDEWTDDDDAPVSGDATAERVYFTYGGGPDGMGPHTSVITDDVPSIGQASGTGRGGGRREPRPSAADVWGLGGFQRAETSTCLTVGVETEEERDARLHREEERLRSLPGWEGRFTYLDEQRRQRDLETGGWAGFDADDGGVPREPVYADLREGGPGDDMNVGDEGRDVAAGGRSPPRGGSGDGETAGDEGQGSMPPPPARASQAGVDADNETPTPEVVHSGASPPPVRGGVGGGWSAHRWVGDRLRVDYDAGRGVFAGRLPAQTQAVEGTSTDMQQGKLHTSGEEGLLMRPETRRHRGITEVEARLAAEVAAGQAALDAIQRQRDTVAAQATEDEDANTESEPLESVVRTRRAVVAAAAAAAQATYISGAEGTGAGGRGGRPGGQHGGSSFGRGRTRPPAGRGTGRCSGRR
ncbi:hypothetical protein CBR_g74652 [Chara braunii]|uniref:HAT C-terminal dimerisation domain-containing protein n=1 Tax=Chara braunii TaxID=69332 RepID=A0A388KA63_CHABU|nr:hypothetical protein CBR_g74652 [Chara braunii]|eukprot:GBG66964.1 hypothetical protein CBR_g74652 [Chara braunii]